MKIAPHRPAPEVPIRGRLRTGSPPRGRRASSTVRAALRPAALALALAATLPACRSTPTVSDDPVAPGLADYQATRYARAYEAAQAAAASSTGVERDEARYIAGMSAYRLGRHTEAIGYLGPLTKHRRPDIAGPANAAMGLIHAARDRHDQAILYHRQAVKMLEGEDLAHAYFHLAASEQKLGRHPSAQAHFSLALSHTADPAFRSTVRQRLSATGWTLQLGAFGERSNADELARDARDLARRIGLDPPRVQPATVEGRQLYLVQLGRFGSYDSALQARRRLNRTNAIIQPLAD